MSLNKTKNKLSLKEHLYYKIKNDAFGFVPIEELHFIAGTDHRRQSNAERRLRELREAGLIERVMSNGVVIGYKIPQAKQSNEPKLIPVDYKTLYGKSLNNL